MYELLSGHRPYRVSGRLPEEIVQAILREEPERPSTVGRRQTAEGRKKGASHDPAQGTADNGLLTGPTNPKSKIRNPKFLRGDLDNIVLKALRKEPQRRYASVQEFSEDIRRHLEGLPVTASPDTFSYRSGKFIQRNKAGVLAAAVMLTTLLSATVITAWQARVARSERDKAEMRFNQVRKLANSVLFEYHDGIEKLPGSTPVRQRMVKDALDYLDNLSRESGNDPSLQRELAAAYAKVGDVQGAPYRANLGDYAGALASHKKALAIREESSSHSPPRPELKLELARSYGAVGELLQVTGDIPAALENYHKAFAVFDSLSSDGAETKRELSILNVRFGKALAASGELEKALQTYRKGIAITNELSAATPTEPGLKRAQAYAQIFLGDALEESGLLKEALAAQRSAFAFLEPLVTQTDAQSRRDVNVAYGRIADVLAKMGDKRGALEIDLKVLAIDEDLAKADPSNALTRRDVYIDYYKIAFMQETISDMRAALTNQRKCVALCEAEVVANPASSESRSDLGVAYFRLGEMFENIADHQEALRNYQKAVEIKASISIADPANTVARGDLSEDYWGKLPSLMASLRLNRPS